MEENKKVDNNDVVEEELLDFDELLEVLPQRLC